MGFWCRPHAYVGHMLVDYITVSIALLDLIVSGNLSSTLTMRSSRLGDSTAFRYINVNIPSLLESGYSTDMI